MLKSIILSFACVVSAVLFSLPVFAQAALNATDAPGPSNRSDVSLIALYTQLIKLLQQEIIALEPTPTIAASSTSAMSPSLPSWLDDWNKRAPRGYIPGFGGGGSAPPPAPAPTPPPAPAPYIAKAVHLDGSTYLTNSSLVAPDSSQWSMVWWFKTTQSAPDATFLVVDPDNAVVPYITLISGVIDDELAATPNPASTELQTNATFNDGTWHSAVFSIDASTSAPHKYKMYIDDVAVTWRSAFDNGSAFTVLGNGLKTMVGYDDIVGDAYIGDLADSRVFYGVSLLDGSGDIPLATRRLFRNASGKPVDPAVATAALGVGGTIFLSGDASSFGINQGTGGSFTKTGTLTNAATSPSN